MECLQPDISAIVPVYKAESYMKRCLGCLSSQKACSFEVVLVDDGSPDASGKICDEYAAKDGRFRVIHKLNGGVASARQAGLKAARGEYVIHVDPDDWIEPTMLEELYRYAKLNDADMVICDYYEHRNDGEHYINQQPKSLNPYDIIVELFDGTLHGSCCNKLVRRDCIVINQVKFPDLALCEDTYFNVALLLNPLKVAYLDKAFYHYNRLNAGSVTREANPHSGVYAYKACSAFRNLIGGDKRLWTVFVNREMPWMAYLSLYYGSISSEHYKRAFHDLCHRSAKNSNERMTQFALKHFYLSRCIMEVRKFLGRIRKTLC